MSNEAPILEYKPTHRDLQLSSDSCVFHMGYIDDFNPKGTRNVFVKSTNIYLDNLIKVKDPTKFIPRHLVDVTVFRCHLPMQDTYVLHIPQYKHTAFMFACQMNGLSYWYESTTWNERQGKLEELFDDNYELNRIITLAEIYGS